MTRLDRFKKLLETYWATPTDYDEGEEEDPRPYFDGSRELEKYALTTVNWSSQGEAKFFFLAFDSLAEAQSRAVEYMLDDIFEEAPVEIRDLDTDQVWAPYRPRVSWTTNEPGAAEAQAVQRAAEGGED